MAAIPSIPRRTRLFVSWFILGTAFVVLDIDVLVSSAFDSFVSDAVAVLPMYTRSQRAAVAIKIPQVAVLYFAVLVTAVQFTNEDQQFAYESDPLLYLFFPLSIILVSFSALSAILSVLGLSPKISLVTSLGLMSVAFLLSSLATVITGVGKVNDQERFAGGKSASRPVDSGGSDDSITETDESDDQIADTDGLDSMTEATEDTDETNDDTGVPDSTDDDTDNSAPRDDDETESLEGKEP